MLLEQSESLELSTKTFYKQSQSLNSGFFSGVSDFFSGLLGSGNNVASPSSSTPANPLYDASSSSGVNPLGGGGGYFSSSSSSCTSTSAATSFQNSNNSSSASSNRRPLDILIALQGFKGNWKLDQQLADVVGIDLETLRKSKKDFKDDEFATAVAIAFLEIRFAESKVEWELIVKKARKFLKNEEIIKEASKMF